MKEDALNIELDSMLYINGHLAYQTGLYFSVIDSIIQDYAEARKYLEHNLHMISEAGNSFKNIILHNLKYCNQMKTIEWGKTERTYSQYSFILDPRIW